MNCCPLLHHHHIGLSSCPSTNTVIPTWTSLSPWIFSLHNTAPSKIVVDVIIVVHHRLIIQVFGRTQARRRKVSLINLAYSTAYPNHHSRFITFVDRRGTSSSFHRCRYYYCGSPSSIVVDHHRLLHLRGSSLWSYYFS